MRTLKISGRASRSRSNLSKANPYRDGSTGRFTTGGTKGGSGLTRRQMYELQLNQSDPNKSAVYAAENKFQPQVQRQLPKPFPPNNRNEYPTPEAYDAAYKDYSDKFNAWARESSRNIQSDLGAKHLDGTRQGVQNYLNEVTGSDWFIEEFGDSSIVEIPKVSLNDARVAGQYTFGFKLNKPYSAFTINRNYPQAEPTILHEIAHYATTISAKTPFGAHGKQFAKNHIFMASKIIGEEYADGLAAAYKGEGIKLD